jgi:hypothetical protein
MPRTPPFHVHRFSGVVFCSVVNRATPSDSTARVLEALGRVSTTMQQHGVWSHVDGSGDALINLLLSTSTAIGVGAYRSVSVARCGQWG